MKYRKKPIVIDAVQWFPGLVIDGVNEMYDCASILDRFNVLLKVRPGDWIITGIMGEKYPCSPDVFEKTYEKV